jgi:processive 1,2-diacylglycerol beta-glucosyltransferase
MGGTLDGGPVIRLYDAATNAPIGTLTDAQLQFLIDRLEEESVHDRDYYLNRDTLEMFEQAGGDPALIALLRGAMGERTEMDVRWERD